jgi:hypothetical protein
MNDNCHIARVFLTLCPKLLNLTGNCQSCGNPVAGHPTDPQSLDFPFTAFTDAQATPPNFFSQDFINEPLAFRFLYMVCLIPKLFTAYL